jgi:hypothetical protein
MRWVVLSILIFIPIYTYLVLHYRKPGKMFEPYKDIRDRADVIRLLRAGYRRVAVEATRPVDGAAPRDTAAPSAGGIPHDLRETIVESPLLPEEIVSVSAAPTAASGIDYPISLTYTQPDNHRQLSGAHVYAKPGEIVIVADFERIEGDLLARTREESAVLDIPPRSIAPGRYRVTLVGEKASRTWALQVR